MFDLVMSVAIATALPVMFAGLWYGLTGPLLRRYARRVRVSGGNR
ncbi:MAG TPA: hypothetical protein VF060_12790 [Trebonia sp.]